MTKPILIIDPGHGGTDPGAVANGIQEKDYVLRISLYQMERFIQLGVPVAITRTTDVRLDPGPRTTAVKNSGAKYCISNHLNAAGNTTAAGVETIHSMFSDGKLAHALFEAIAAEGVPKRRVFLREGNGGRDYYFMHRETGAVETVIVEYDFITNAQGAQRIKANWQRYAEAVVRAFCLFIGHRYTAPGEEKKKDQQSEATYVVKQGDTLGKIAAAHGTDVGTLVQLNNLSNPNLIRIGQVIKLPHPKDDLEDAIKVLQNAGIIGSPDYWLEHAREGQSVKGSNARDLILKISNHLGGK